MRCDQACFTGRVVFLLVPLALWLLFAAIVHRRGFWAKVLALIAGSDNRLSLSRLQALAWTLVIIGSYAAAMAIHRPLVPANSLEVSRADSLLVEHEARTRTAEDELRRRTDDSVRYASALRDALADSAGQSGVAAAENGPPATQPSFGKLMAARRASDYAANELKKARSAHDRARADVNDAELRAAQLHWVRIPGALLALASLTIGSGVLSSLISVANREAKTACVTVLRQATAADLASHNLVGSPTDHWRIEGTDFGARGRVRLGRVDDDARISFAVNDVAPTPVWEDQLIVARLPSNAAYNVLVVDSPNGKVAYQVEGAGRAVALGSARSWYEFSDLFRDDKNPDHYDLMKFQMFAWTAIAIAIYIRTVIEPQFLTPTLQSLPMVDESIVALTGVSLAAYLGSKTVTAGAAR
jgi:hypothetical protein